MSDRIPVTCPNCRSALKIRTEFFGRRLECKRCRHRFAPSPADLIDPTSLPEPSIGPPPDEKVPVECPGCRRTLRVRPQYLGAVVLCKSCERRFVAMPASGDESPRGPAGRAEGPRREDDGPDRDRLAFERQVGQLAGRLGGVEARLEELHLEKPGWAAEIERAAAGWEDHRRDFAALEANFSSVRTEFEEFRGKMGSGWEAEGRAFAGEVEARFEGERDLDRRQLEQLRIEVEGLGRLVADLAGRGLEAEARERALESRLGLLEGAADHGTERGSRLEERLRELEGAEVERGAIGEEVGLIRDQVHSLRQLAADQAEALRAGLEASRAEDSAIRRAIGGREGHHARLESAMASLDALRLDGEQGVAVLREELEAGQHGLREEVEKLHQQLRQVAGDQAGRHGRLEGLLDRLDAGEAERNLLRQALENFRRELDAMRRDALAQSERSRSELAGLHAAMETRTSSPSPVVAASSAPRPDPEGTPPLPAVSITGPSAITSRFNFDQLALDLVLDQSVRPGGRSEAEGPATNLATSSTGAGVPAPSSPKATPDPSDVTAECQRFGEQFLRSMNQGDYAGGIATARHLVAYTGDHYGDRSLEQALWLRNLGVGLSRAGEMAEARATLHRALDICRLKPDSDQNPAAICLIDLAELYLAMGDRRQAKTLCQQSLAILTKGHGPDNPFVMRAHGCMARIGAADPGLSAIGTTSIST